MGVHNEGGPGERAVIVGADTHKHVHVAVAIDTWGVRLGDRTCSADSGGYTQLIRWAEALGRIASFGIEGTGSYGVGLASAVRRAGHQVFEVNRGDRRCRRVHGKSDTVDAEAAARAVLNGQATAVPKTADGTAEMLRQLKVARDTAVKAKTAAITTLKQIVVNAPPALREELDALGEKALITRCAAFRPTDPIRDHEWRRAAVGWLRDAVTALEQGNLVEARTVVTVVSDALGVIEDLHRAGRRRPRRAAA